MMRRREFITLLGGAAAAWPVAARAQQPAMPVIGYLSASWPVDRAHLVAAFRAGVRESGFVEGRNVTIDYHWAQDRYDQLPTLAAELVRRRVAVIAAMDTLSATAAKAATTTMPIVFAGGGDPVRDGLVASINRPGGNVTGVTFLASELGTKQLGLLHQLWPEAARVGVLVDPSWPLTAPFLADVRAVASSIGKQIEVHNASSGSDINVVFSSFAQRPVDALLVGPSALTNSRRVQIVTLATYNRLVAIYNFREFAEIGGLMSYGTSITDAHRQAGQYAGRLLKGEKPSDLPVMQSSKFELVINLNTAKAFDLAIPTTLLATADEVIE
jgi:putative tryptophan/tyrosine transport system substrate-binding protein